MPRKIIRYFALILALFALDRRGYARLIEIRPHSLGINLITSQKETAISTKQLSKFWQKSCRTLGRSMLINHGPQGNGVFKDYYCFIDRKPKGGTGPKSLINNQWILEIRFEAKEVLFQLLFNPEFTANPDLTPEMEFSIRYTDQTMNALSDPEVLNLIALKVLDAMPMARATQVTPNGVQEVKSKPDQIKRVLPLPPGPKQYLVYRLQYDSQAKTWIPTVKGIAKNLTKRRKAKSEDPEVQIRYRQVHRWQIKLLSKPLATEDFYWLQNAKGRGKEEKAIDNNLDMALSRYGLARNELLAALFNTIASGYGGVRYGYPLSSGDLLVSKTSMIGIFTEVRGGPLEGLRWYWDFGPRNEVTLSDEKLHFEWSRPTFGWSFGLDIDSNIINRIDVVPKIGWMNMDARVGVPTQDPSVIIAEDFVMDNSLSVGIEFGIEKQTNWFLLRLWGASDGAGFFSNLPGAESVSSIRGGVDTYWEVFNLGDIFDVSLLAFASGERINLVRSASNDVESGSEVLSIDGIAYNLAFAGIGMTLTW